MWRPSTGFLIMIGLMFTLGVMAVPELTRTTAHGWEVCTIASLRNISSAQEQFRAGGHVDLDGDDRGEYGSFQELSGRTVLRGRVRTLSPPVLSGAWRIPAAPGVVKRSGYYFSIWLADRNGLAVRERTVPAMNLVAVIPGGGWEVPSRVVSTARVRFTRKPDPDWSEVVWCAYAWPVKYGEGSHRTFFVDGVSGEIFATEDPDYGGLRGPRPAAAFGDSGRARITGVPARNAVGRDGNLWTRVN